MTHIKPSKSEKGLADVKPNEERAADLKTRYPEIQVMQTSITAKREFQLLLEYAANGGSLVLEDQKKIEQKKVEQKKIEEVSKGERRARKLKEMYPDMKGIPKTIGPKIKKKLIAAYEKSKKASRKRREDRTVKDVRPMVPVQDTKVHKLNAQRALVLKRMFPGMRGIPNAVNCQEITSLIANQLGEDMASATKATKEVMNLANGQTRALQLRKKCPNMQGIPDSISEDRFQRLSKAYKQSKGRVMDAKLRLENPQKSRLALPVTNPTQSDSIVKSLRSATSSKMAPISDERRAEVARNLSGNSDNDPITLD